MKNIIKTVAFLLILCVILAAVNGVCRFKYVDGIYTLQKYYELPQNSVDVLFLGSSHAGMINPALLWRDHGIASYTLWGSKQPISITYYYLKEALKTQKPRVVVLESYMIAKEPDGGLAEYSTLVKNTLGMKLSGNKLEMIRSNAAKELFFDIVLGFPTYHSREKFSRSDFKKDYGYEQLFSSFKGYVPFFASKEYSTPDVSGVTAVAKPGEKTEAYLEKIIELCRENGIELAFYLNPYHISAEEQAVFNYVEKLAEEKGIKFLNGNLLYEEMGIDFSSDFIDDAHTNVSGTDKATGYLGEWLCDSFELGDSRGKAGLESWNENLRLWDESVSCEGADQPDWNSLW